MPLFVCDKCETVENTSLGFYWGKDDLYFDIWKDKTLHGLALCSECSPSEYEDGSSNESGGKWHGHWEKFKATEDSIKEQGIKNFVYLGRFSYLRGG